MQILPDSNFDQASLIGVMARGADFRDAINLTPAQLTTFDSLYQVKFDLSTPIQQNQFKPEAIKRLENFIIYSYREALRTIHKREKTTDKKAETAAIKAETEQLDGILSLIRCSGFSPLQWAVEETKFNETFELMRNQYKQILEDLKQKTANVIANYPKERLNVKGSKSVLKPVQCASRTHQLKQLETIQTAQSIIAIMNILTSIQAEIKKEFKFWPSDLLKKIDHLIDEARNTSLSTDQKNTPQSLNQ